MHVENAKAEAKAKADEAAAACWSTAACIAVPIGGFAAVFAVLDHMKGGLCLCN